MLHGYMFWIAPLHISGKIPKNEICIRILIHRGLTRPTRGPPYITEYNTLADNAANCVQRIPENLGPLFRRITIVDSADKEILESKGRMHIPADFPAQSPRQHFRGCEDSITSEKPFTEMNGKEVKDLSDLPTQ
jgi:hypothetical protein